MELQSSRKERELLRQQSPGKWEMANVTDTMKDDCEGHGKSETMEAFPEQMAFGWRS
jgi:hypothetical protein